MRETRRRVTVGAYLAVREDGTVVSVKNTFNHPKGAHIVYMLLHDIGCEDSIEREVLWWLAVSSLRVFQRDQSLVRKRLGRAARA
jgi:hypothetical protein